MKLLKLGLIGLLVSTLGLLSAAPVIAQTEVKVTPPNLTVAGTRGIRITRTLLLQTQSPITDLKFISLDLNNGDGIAVLPARIIQPPLLPKQIEANGLLSVPVEFNLVDAPNSGEFSGILLVTYKGGELVVPLTIKVKDPWLLPLVVLATGVALGMAVSAYRNKGRPRDEILVRVGQLRTQLRTDMDLERAKPFQLQIEAHLLDVGMALQAERWDYARQAVEQAETVWLKWRKGHDDWLAQMNYRDELEKQLQQKPDDPYLQSVYRNIQQAIREAPAHEPKELQEQLNAYRQQINQYLLLRAELDRLNELRTQLPSDKGEPWRLKVQSFEQRFNTLDPTDKNAYQELQSDVKAAIAELESLVPQSGRGIETEMPKPVPPAPPTLPPTIENQATGAKVRLQIFSITSYAIALTLLAGAGFIELYVAKATFGANYWSDYFTLLAWGFGAEATRESITKVVRDWGIVGLK